MKTITMRVRDCVKIKGRAESEYSNAVYLILRQGEIVYVGKTWRCVPSRLREHLKSAKTWYGLDVEMRIYEPGETNVGEIELQLINSIHPSDNKRQQMDWSVLDSRSLNNPA